MNHVRSSEAHVFGTQWSRLSQRSNYELTHFRCDHTTIFPASFHKPLFCKQPLFFLVRRRPSFSMYNMEEKSMLLKKLANIFLSNFTLDTSFIYGNVVYLILFSGRFLHPFLVFYTSSILIRCSLSPPRNNRFPQLHDHIVYLRKVWIQFSCDLSWGWRLKFDFSAQSASPMTDLWFHQWTQHQMQIRS